LLPLVTLSDYYQKMINMGTWCVRVCLKKYDIFVFVSSVLYTLAMRVGVAICLRNRVSC